jgi:hypothetical protein
MPSNLDEVDDPWSDADEDYDPFQNGPDVQECFEQPPSDHEVPPAEVAVGSTTTNTVQLLLFRLASKVRANCPPLATVRPLLLWLSARSAPLLPLLLWLYARGARSLVQQGC